MKQSWPSIKKAYDWCLTTDADGDGLMDNRKAGLGALEFGSLTGIQTDIFLAAAWTRAAYAMERLARVAGDPAYERDRPGSSGKSRESARREILGRGQRPIRLCLQHRRQSRQGADALVRRPARLGPGRRRTGACRTLEKINAADLTTDWGVRMLSSASPFFEPLNYNYGAVWPFLTGWVATRSL